MNATAQTAHTPGPWSMQVSMAAETIGYVSSPGCDHGDIATTWNDNHLSNARLIAAAPDLLAALAPFAAVAEHDIGQDEADADLFQVMSEKNARAPRLTVGHLRAALAAIAKAVQS